MTKKQKEIDLFIVGLSIFMFVDDSVMKRAFYKKPANRHMCKALLNDWEISDAEEYKQALEWFVTTGAREQYDHTVQDMRMLPSSELAEFTSHGQNPDYDEAMKKMQQWMHRMPRAGILGFDYGRAVMLLISAVEMAYIKEAAARIRILELINVLQQEYDSWETYFESYMVGTEFSLLQAGEPLSRQAEKAGRYIRRVMISPESPVNLVPWHTQFGEI